MFVCQNASTRGNELWYSTTFAEQSVSSADLIMDVVLRETSCIIYMELNSAFNSVSVSPRPPAHLILYFLAGR